MTQAKQPRKKDTVQISFRTSTDFYVEVSKYCEQQNAMGVCKPVKVIDMFRKWAQEGFDRDVRGKKVDNG